MRYAKEGRRPGIIRVRVLRLLGTALIVATVPSCGWRPRPLRPADVRPLPNAIWRGNGPKGSFVPIRGLDSMLAASPSEPVYLLVVHGMTTHEAGYSMTLQRGLGGRLGLRHRQARAGGDSVEMRVVTRGYDITMGAGPQPMDSGEPLPESQLRTHVWEDPTSGKARLIAYELLWAPTRDRVKARYFACFETGESPTGTCEAPRAVRNTDKPATVNRMLKYQVIVEGFSDASVVLGPVGDVLRDDATLAMCLVSLDIVKSRGIALPREATRAGRRCDIAAAVSPGDWDRANDAIGKAEFSVVSHSLGSFLVMDAQWKALEAMGQRIETVIEDSGTTAKSRARLRAAREAAQDSLANERDVALFSLLDDATVFMRANQVALLMLGRLQPHCNVTSSEASCPNEALRSATFWRSQPRSTMTQYVAFNDIDDLLGMELPPYLSGPGLFGTIVNVSVTNPAKRLFGVLRNPAEVHTRSDENPAVLDAIVHGFAIEGSALPPKEAPRQRDATRKPM